MACNAIFYLRVTDKTLFQKNDLSDLDPDLI